MSNAASSQHVEPSLRDQRILCPDKNCPLTFSDPDEVYEHHVSQHGLELRFFNGRVKPFKCPLCGKTYKKEDKGNVHINTHRPKPRGSAVSRDQPALFEQSRVAVADRERTEAQRTTGISSGHDDTTESEAVPSSGPTGEGGRY